MSTYSVKVSCARTETCDVRDKLDRNKRETHHYVGHDLEAHQLVLLPLYAHTQHGSCGLDVELE